jgi:hypothetical protein
MNYELAMQLKDAGWPQNGGCGFEQKHTEKGPCVTVPKLEELIEACGEKLEYLERDLDPDVIWIAFSTQSDSGVFGKTPTESVARLWLALNKK